MNLSDKIKLLPNEPGVYQFKDSNGKVIYVGKAKNLKKRVSQYFRKNTSHTHKTEVMVSKIVAIEHTVVNSESDAFLLENNLIKELQPKYNILLKDSKTYPWICVTNEPFPRLFITRTLKNDKSHYFGPYSSSLHAHNLLLLINSIYKIRTCKLSLTTSSINLNKYKVCLNYHLKKCEAPCIGNISQQYYQDQFKSIVEILKGNTSCLIKEYTSKMNEASMELRYEAAQIYKERKELLERHYSKSLIISASNPDFDVFSIIFEGSEGFGNFMRVRNGSLIQSINLEIKMRIEEPKEAALSLFIASIYSRLNEITPNIYSPKEIIVPFYPDQKFVERNFHIPIKGDKLSLLELSRKNASAMKYEKLKRESFVNPKEHTERIMENLMRDLEMNELPRHIECFDNSNLQGTNPVASCVVFKNGTPSKKDYRHFNIKTVVGANDFASMKEVVNRRYSRMLKEGEELPQLVIVDGGKGQVSFAYEAMKELGLIGKIKVVGIAKRLEELIIPGEALPIFLDKNSTSLRVIMSLRDEAHRFGIAHHRNKRSTSQIVSVLDEIPGVGTKSKEKLIAKFKTISRIKSGSYKEIVELIGKKPADSLFRYFHPDS